ncbi:MAG: VCBS repeat-containing protein, partial [Cyanobacteriota bacterium]|nr:VCBS repeat-containing protein [Cyanobacteriota bacterium]
MTVSFNPTKNFEVENEPNALAIGDFNGDGKEDLVTKNKGTNLFVLLGDDNGSFSDAQNIEYEEGPTSIGIFSPTIGVLTVGDFNLDGKDDIATTNRGNNISILLGDGNGGFNPAQNFGLENVPVSITLGDFNGDGFEDIATGNSAASISVMLGDGSGGFSSIEDFELEDIPVSITVGDFNDDGFDDLATANQAAGSDNLSVFFGDGIGGFSDAQNFEVGSFPSSVTVGDFNDDGKDDLAVEVDNGVSVLIGDGNGEFSPAQNFEIGSFPSSVIVGDFNGDGFDDIGTANADESVSVILGDGTGDFSPAQNFSVEDGLISFTVGTLKVGDFNDDGKDDLATINLASKEVSVLTTRDNNPPTDLTLSNDTIAENNSFFSEVGIFTTTDLDTDETFTYELITGEGDTDNSSFIIEDDKLIALEKFDFETKSSYDIRVKTTDFNNESFEKTLTVNVSDVFDTPTIRTVTDNGNEMEIIDLTGNPGQIVIANFEIDRDAAYDNNVYFYKVDSDDGNIGGLTPDDSGYLQTALNNVVNPDFGLNANQDATSTTGSLSLTGGDILGIVIVADGTLQQAVSNIDSVEGVYLSYMGAGASTDNGTF